MENISTAVFTFGELSEAAQEKAVDEIAERLRGIWWGNSNRETVANDMVYELAVRLGTPGHEKYGEGDFPGVDGVTLDGWAIDMGGEVIAFSGRLTRENAPALPWVDLFDAVELVPSCASSRRFTVVSLVEADAECWCDPFTPGHEPTCDLGQPRAVDNDAAERLEQAVKDAISAAWKSGKAADETMTGPEVAREKAADHRFLIDGTFYA